MDVSVSLATRSGAQAGAMGPAAVASRDHALEGAWLPAILTCHELTTSSAGGVGRGGGGGARSQQQRARGRWELERGGKHVSMLSKHF